MKPVLILYGSQTGAAKSIAETIHGDAAARGFHTVLAALNDYSRVDLLNAPVAVVVSSTTGNGDPPNNAEEFWRFLRKRTHPKDLFARLQFVVLGLGDTNYDKFCNAAKTIHRRLGELGGSEFYKLGLADESMGLESVVDPWIKGLWPALSAACDACGGGGGASAGAAQEPPAARTGATGASAAPVATTSSAAAAATAANAAVGPTPPPRISVVGGGGGEEAPLPHDAATGGATGGVLDMSALHSPMAMIRAVTAQRAATEAAHRHQEASAVAAASVAVAATTTHAAPASAPHNVVVAAAAAAAAATAAAAPAAAAPRVAGSPAAAATAAPPALQPHVELHPVHPVHATATPGVRTLRQLLPALTFARDGAPLTTTAGACEPTPPLVLCVPPSDVTAASKFMPKVPPVAWAARVLVGDEAAAADTAAALQQRAAAPVPAQAAVVAAAVAAAPPQTAGSSVPGTPSRRLVAGGSSATVAGPAHAAPSNGGVVSLCGPARSLESPVAVPLSRARYLTSGGSASERRVVHVECDVTGTPLEGAWSPGDAVGVIVPNPPDLVVGLCARLCVAPGSRVVFAAAAAPSASPQDASPVASPAPAAAVASSLVPTWLVALHATAAPHPSPPGAPISGGGSGDGGGSGAAAAGTPPPPWVPTLEDVLTWAVDVTSPPKKALVRLLAEHAREPHEQDALMWLVSRLPGASDAWAALVEGQRLTLLDVLCLFPSVSPPLGALLSALPSLPPRFYSLSSSPLADPRTIAFAFTVVQYSLAPCATPPAAPAAEAAGAGAEAARPPAEPEDGGSPAFGGAEGGGDESPATPGPCSAAAPPLVRRGLATTWLEQLCRPLLGLCPPPTGGTSPRHVVGGSGSAGSSSSSSVIRLFLRPTRDFLLPAAPERPVIMVGPGTGVSPFRGFLQHRRARLDRDAAAATAVCTGRWRPGLRFGGGGGGVPLREDPEFYTPLALGPAHLFFGNRSAELDFLYREELQTACADGSLSALHTAWSRPPVVAPPAPGGGAPPTKTYVQHRMAQAGRALAELILCGAGGGAHVYVCGDGARMARDVHAALVDILVAHSPHVAAAAAAAAAASTGSTLVAPGGSTGDATPGGSGGSGGSVPVLATEAQAADFLAGLAKRGRYVRDIWS